jgi:hypothetical protein
MGVLKAGVVPQEVFKSCEAAFAKVCGARGQKDLITC